MANEAQRRPSLTDPRIDIALRNVLIAAAAVCAVWTGIVAYEASAARAEVAAQSITLETKKSQMDTADINFRAQRRTSRLVGQIPQAAPSQGTAAFAAMADALIRHTGATLVNIRFGTTSNGDDKSSGSGHGGDSDIFDCTIEGQFPALMRIVDGFATSAGGVTIVSTDFSRAQMDPKTGTSIVTMHMMGKLDP